MGDKSAESVCLSWLHNYIAFMQVVIVHNPGTVFTYHGALQSREAMNLMASVCLYEFVAGLHHVHASGHCAQPRVLLLDFDVE